jgi:hypothetical protein
MNLSFSHYKQFTKGTLAIRDSLTCNLTQRLSSETSQSQFPSSPNHKTTTIPFSPFSQPIREHAKPNQNKINTVEASENLLYKPLILS